MFELYLISVVLGSIGVSIDIARNLDHWMTLLSLKPVEAILRGIVFIYVPVANGIGFLVGVEWISRQVLRSFRNRRK